MKLEHINLAVEIRETLAVLDESLEFLKEESFAQDVPLLLLQNFKGKYRALNIYLAKANLLAALAQLSV